MNNPMALEFHLRVGRGQRFTFDLGQAKYQLHLSERGQFLTGNWREERAVHLFYIDAQGQVLGEIFSIYRQQTRQYIFSHTESSLRFGENSLYPTDDIQEKIAKMEQLGDNTKVFLVISLLPYTALFDRSAPEQER